MEHIVKSYDDDINQLYSHIRDMVDVALQMVDIASNSLNNIGKNFVDDAKSTDKILNRLDYSLEQEAVKMLALRQPMAIDLRVITAAIKISVSLERIGDIAKNIVKSSAKSSAKIPDNIHNNLNQMAVDCKKAIEMAAQSFENKNIELAKQVWLFDDKIDDMRDILFGDLSAHIKQNPADTDILLHSLFAAKNFERIGDYANIIAKQVFFVVNGERATKADKPIL